MTKGSDPIALTKRMLLAAGALLVLCTASIGLAQNVVPLRPGHQSAGSAARAPLGVVESLVLRRFVDVGGDPDPRILRSPDGDAWLLVTASGDLGANGTWLEFHIGTMEGERPDLRRIARLLTRGYGKPLLPPVSLVQNNHFAWTDNSRRVAFLWEDDREIRQIATLDVANGAFDFVTRSDTDILKFRASQNGRRFLFTTAAPRPAPAARPAPNLGTVVQSGNFHGLVNRDATDREGEERERLYAVEPDGAVRQIALPPWRGSLWFDAFEISPDGNYAAIPLPVASAPDAWRRYRDPLLSRLAPEMGTADNMVSTLALVDLRAGTATRPVDAPLGLQRLAFLWSPDSRHLLVGPTFEPLDSASEAGLEGRAILRIDPATGAARAVPLPADAPQGQRLIPHAWDREGISFSSRADPSQRYHFNDLGETWSREGDVHATTRRRAGIRIVEDLNTPPRVIWSSGASGEPDRVMLGVDPRLSAVSLAPAELVQWVASDGSRWTGLLYVPPGSAQGTRVPLVIQMKPFSRTEFSILGSDSYPSVFAAQTLAGRGIAVLQVGYPDPGSEVGSGTVREQRVMLGGIEGAITHLSGTGLIDPQRVGLVGFSRTGYYVEYAIAHSRMRFAAAIAADNIDYGYFQTGLAGWPADASSQNGGDALSGEGLTAWMAEAPAFNADRIEAPLRLQSHSGSAIIGMLHHWEMFSRLRALNRPVELFLVPEIERGTHSLENPRQLLASRGGAVDWLLFWLLGEERTQPVTEFGETAATLQAQYSRWHVLRAQRDALVSRRTRSQ